NRAICTTNKLFFYMLGGLAVAATSVPGQLSIISEYPGCAASYLPGDYRALAGVIDGWTRSQAALEKAKARALDAARQRFNWESESKRLVEAVSRALESHRYARPIRPKAMVAL